MMERHPDYGDLAARALAARRGEQVRFTVADALVAADLVEALV